MKIVLGIRFNLRKREVGNADKSAEKAIGKNNQYYLDGEKDHKSPCVLGMVGEVEMSRD